MPSCLHRIPYGLLADISEPYSDSDKPPDNNWIALPKPDITGLHRQRSYKDPASSKTQTSHSSDDITVETSQDHLLANPEVPLSSNTIYLNQVVTDIKPEVQEYEKFTEHAQI